MNLVDAPASELWASNTMEARPFKDANYDLKRVQLETGIQAVARLRDVAIQVSGVVSAGWFLRACSSRHKIKLQKQGQYPCCMGAGCSIGEW